MYIITVLYLVQFLGDENEVIILSGNNSKDGYKAVMLNYKTVIINTTLDKDLINEGFPIEIKWC